MRSHVGVVVAVTGVVEAFTEAPPMSGVERFVAVVTALPVGDMQLRDAAMVYGRPVARAAVRRGVYRAAAVGAAAAGAYGYYGGYYNNRCYQDGYGNPVCPQQYPY